MAATSQRQARAAARLDKLASEASSSSSEAASSAPSKAIRLANKNFVNTTPHGEKKDVSGAPAEAYDPPSVEAAWYAWWDKQGYFQPRQSDNSKFVMIMPPPNVTGRLHAGHALMASVEDALARWHRMNGREVVWYPGTDHAGIATQAVVEAKLRREERPDRRALGREAFIEEVWAWKNNSGNAICDQLRRMGVSADWSRESFTLDEPRSEAVVEAFVRLYEQGKIYRANRLVNWCCALQTAISDIEVDTKQFNGREKREVPGHKYPVVMGVMDHFNYRIVGSDELITIATTRLETMLGDTGIAIHPDDPRYKHLHGRVALNPINGREIPIVLDPILVKMELGTGCVKITPAHDHNDYECGLRHGLPFINILNPDGTLNSACGKYEGMKRYEAREAIRKELEAMSLFVERKDNPMAIGVCSRSGDIIEPYQVPQWYVDVNEMSAQALEAVNSGALNILPDYGKASWRNWLEKPQPWCVSRQLWWGHRIPAYMVWKKGDARPDSAQQDNWIIARSADEALERARARFPGVEIADLEIEQDADVLDTWFSSGLLPFSNLGWPNIDASDFQRYFPTTLLETGSDILFFWVARMVMMSIALTGQIPFKTVYLHPMVRDAQGRKMSKQKGNVIDPLDIIEGITLNDLQGKLKNGNLDPKELAVAMKGQKESYPSGLSESGTDALRFSLCLEVGHGQSVNLSIDKVVTIRNWCNKLWNALRFATSMFPAGWKPSQTPLACGGLSFIDKWITSRLNNCIETATRGFETYMFTDSCDSLYKFLYNDFCDVYLEAVKPVFWAVPEDQRNTSESCIAASETLYTCMETGLRLLHPFMPFLTEELWQRLPRRSDAEAPSIMISAWPAPFGSNPDIEAEMTIILDICHALRSVRSKYGITSARPPLFIRPLAVSLSPLLAAQATTIDRLGSVAGTQILAEGEAAPPGCSVTVIGVHCELHVGLKGLVDFAKELVRLGKAREKAQNGLNSILKRLSNPAYLAKANPGLIEKDNGLKEQAEFELKTIDEAIEAMNLLKEQNE